VQLYAVSVSRFITYLPSPTVFLSCENVINCFFPLVYLALAKSDRLIARETEVFCLNQREKVRKGNESLRNQN